MRALIQRVSEASVTVEDQEVGRIGSGLLVFLGFTSSDEETDSLYLVDKVVNLRIFADDDNRFNRSALDVEAELLLVSQFTLYADTRKGRRPDFNQAAGPDQAGEAYYQAVELFRKTGLTVATGQFQEYMQVRIQNDGPVTIMLDSADRNRPHRG
ncbi:MAG: D-aminoacyl-tRNA deacylase [Chloroflexota bacterium]|nr:D-aminoacyl-tRNA deacylase [Chloroflexota bacterium]